MLRVTSLFSVFFHEASLRAHVKHLVLAVSSLLTVKSQSNTEIRLKKVAIVSRPVHS